MMFTYSHDLIAPVRSEPFETGIDPEGGPRGEVVEGKPVDRVDDDRYPCQPGGQAADETRLRSVRVDDRIVAVREEAGETR